jgi:hypothetical protein
MDEKSKNPDDIRIRKVKSLQGRARQQAITQGLVDNDLVVIKTRISSLPQYEFEKITGDPLKFLLKLGKA